MSLEDPVYVAHATHPSLGEDTRAGTLAVGPHSFIFEFDGGKLEFPFKDCSVEARETSEGDLLCLEHPSHPDWSVLTYNLDLLKHRVFAQHTHLRMLARQTRADLEGTPKAMKIAIAGVTALVGIILVLWAGNDWIMRMVVSGVPQAWEDKLGDEVLAEMSASGRMINDPAATASIRALGEKIAKGMGGGPHKFTFHLRESPVVNACALPGGHIVVNTGLIESAETGEEIAGVMAHEMAHHTERHLFRKIADAAGPFLVFQAALHNRSALLVALSEGSALIGQQRFSRHYEREADDKAFDYLVAAGIDPRGLASFFRKVHAAEGRGGDELSFLNSHPPTQERIEHLDKRWETFPYKSTCAKVPKPSIPAP